MPSDLGENFTYYGSLLLTVSSAMNHAILLLLLLQLLLLLLLLFLLLLFDSAAVAFADLFELRCASAPLAAAFADPIAMVM